MDFFDKEISELKSRFTETQAPQNQNTNEAGAQSLSVPFWSELIESGHRKRRLRARVFIILMILIVLSLNCYVLMSIFFGKGWLSNGLFGNNNMSFTLPVYETPKLEDNLYQEDGRYTTVGLAEALSPSVVSISVSYDFTPETLSAGVALGSGIIISEDGYIVTNAHVVEGDPIAIKVILNSGDQYAADVVGLDSRSDIAVLKIAADGLSPAVFADSDSVRPGEDVAAIGNPAGFSGSITKGIVSAVGRGIRVQSDMLEMECIQIDAAINPGNSGGALFNMWGQVVGIISSKLSATMYDGIGFAITTNAAKPIIEELIEKGCIESRTRVGITFYGISDENAKINGYPTGGLYINGISKDCDISNTELKSGDVITHINGVKVTDVEEITEALKGFLPGDTVSATVARLNDDQTAILSTFEISFKLEKDSSMTSGFEKE